MITQVDKCVDVAVTALAAIEQHEQEIASHKMAIGRIKDDLRDALAAAARGLNQNERHELAYLLYWHTPVAADTVGKLMGVGTSNALTKVIGPFPSGDFCAWCNKEFMFTSRTERTNTIREGRKYLGLLCDECRNLHSEQDDADYRQRQNERAAQVAVYKAMPYREYLHTEHWQAIRGSALKRSRYRCQLCNADGLLDVHHRTYERRGEEHAADVIVLCRNCHGTFHGKV